MEGNACPAERSSRFQVACTASNRPTWIARATV